MWTFICSRTKPRIIPDLRRYFPEVVPRKAMFIKSNSPGNVFAFVGQEFAVDLRHECTHALLHATLPMVPLWLDEGLAEYFELPAAQRAEGNPNFSQVKRSSYWKRPAAIEQLEMLAGLGQMGVDEYRAAWSWVHFMLHGPPAAKAELVEFLQQIANHTPPTKLSERLHAKFPQLERAYVDHFRKWRR